MKAESTYLDHMRDALDRVLAYTAEGREAFFADTRTQDAVIRNLEILGEAAKGISAATRDASPHIPWRAVAGMRDKLIHEYFGVNLVLVWEVVARDVPALRHEVGRLLGDASVD